MIGLRMKHCSMFYKLFIFLCQNRPTTAAQRAGVSFSPRDGGLWNYVLCVWILKVLSFLKHAIEYSYEK